MTNNDTYAVIRAITRLERAYRDTTEEMLAELARLRAALTTDLMEVR